MEKGFQALLLEGEYPLSPAFTQDVAVYPLMYSYVASPVKTEPYYLNFNQLPNLRSLEQLNSDDVPAAKRVKNLPDSRAQAKQRRQTISEKFRCLQKLIPCDRKMDTSTMLEEAHKYIRFLQAQVSALHSMPFLDQTAQSVIKADVYGGALMRLSRQQMLEIVLKSHVAQNVLYTRGCCVYSVEQMALLQRIVDQRNFVFGNFN